MGRCKTHAQHMLFAFFSLPYACHGEAKRSCLFYCTLSNKVKLINIQIFSFFFFGKWRFMRCTRKKWFSTYLMVSPEFLPIRTNKDDVALMLFARLLRRCLCCFRFGIYVTHLEWKRKKNLISLFVDCKEIYQWKFIK